MSILTLSNFLNPNSPPRIYGENRLLNINSMKRHDTALTKPEWRSLAECLKDPDKAMKILELVRELEQKQTVKPGEIDSLPENCHKSRTAIMHALETPDPLSEIKERATKIKMTIDDIDSQFTYSFCNAGSKPITEESLLEIPDKSYLDTALSNEIIFTENQTFYIIKNPSTEDYRAIGKYCNKYEQDNSRGEKSYESGYQTMVDIANEI